MRIALFLLLPVVLTALLVGCVQRVTEAPDAGPTPGGDAASPAPSGGGVELTLFTWTEVDELEVNKELLREFEAAHPGVTVRQVNVSGSREAMQKLETMFAAKAGPDVMSLHGGYYIGFADAGVLEDLDKFIAEDPDFHADDIHPRLVELCRYQGKLFSLPRYTSVYALFYNKALFDAEGLAYPGTGSWTWDDFLGTARKLTQDLDGDGRPDRWGCIIDFWGARLYPWLWSNEADLMDDRRERCVMDSPAAVEAIQFLADLRLTHNVAPPTVSTERNEALDTFARGTVGMYMSGPWDIQTLDRAENLAWDIAPMPTRKRRATMLGTENYAIYSGTRYPQEAWELFKFLLGPRAQAVMADRLDKMPSRLSVLGGAYARGKATYDRQVYVDALEYALLPPNFPEYKQIEGILQAELDRIWIGSVPVPDGLRTATERVNRKLEDLRGSG